MREGRQFATNMTMQVAISFWVVDSSVWYFYKFSPAFGRYFMHFCVRYGTNVNVTDLCLSFWFCIGFACLGSRTLRALHLEITTDAEQVVVPRVHITIKPFWP
jgi:hypothetical protein